MAGNGSAATMAQRTMQVDDKAQFALVIPQYPNHPKQHVLGSVYR